MEMFDLLNEAEQCLSTDYKLSPSKNVAEVAKKDETWDKYISILGEGLDDWDKEAFESMADIHKACLNENVSPVTNPYESLSLPLIRSFWPKLAVRKALHVLPMAGPTLVKYFIKQFAVDKDGNRVQLPSIANGAAAPSGSVSLNQDIASPASTDVLAAASLTSSVSFIMKGSVRITQIQFTNDVSAAATLDVNIPITVDGNFSFSFDAGAGVIDTIIGDIDYKAGIIHLSSSRCGQATQVATGISIVASAATEYNAINKKIKLESEKCIIEATSRPLSAEFSLEFEQDMRALFNIEAQAEIIDIMGAQIATDYEGEIISDILQEIDAYNALNGNSHKRTFSKTPSGTFDLGLAAWFENSLVDLKFLSAEINNASNIGPANYIIANPLDTVVLGGVKADVDGVVQVGAYSWNVVQTPTVPQGRMIVNLKPENERAACYYWAVYKPAEAAVGYPSANIPSLTVLGRYAKKMVRPEAFAELVITA